MFLNAIIIHEDGSSTTFDGAAMLIVFMVALLIVNYIGNKLVPPSDTEGLSSFARFVRKLIRLSVYILLAMAASITLGSSIVLGLFL